MVRQVGRSVMPLVVVALAVSGTVLAAPAQNRAASGYSFRGNGGKALPPIRISQPSTLQWAANGGVFQIFSSGGLGGNVNSQASRGWTYLPAGRYQMQVNAIGSWAITIGAGVFAPTRIAGGFLSYHGNGGMGLPPFTTRRGTTLYWRAGGALFQLFSGGLSGPDVNSQGAHGTTYMNAGRHTVTVNALGAWKIWWRP